MTAHGAAAGPAEVAVAYMTALSAHDLDGALVHWAPGARQYVRGQVDTTAPSGVRKQMEELFGAVPDGRFAIISTTTERDRCAMHWRMTGHFGGESHLQGVRPTGTALELEGIDVFTVRDGLIQANDAFSDTMEFARQVGLMPPRGSLTERLMTRAFNGVTRVRQSLRRS